MTEIIEEKEELNANTRFDVVDDETKKTLLDNRKALNTNRATKQWISCLNEYLVERGLSKVDDMDLDQLPSVMGDFYFSARKKSINEDGVQEKNKSKLKLRHYKNSSLKSGRAAMNRYFKGKFGIDIISNENFIKANEIFQAVTKQGKEEGRGEIQSKQAISDPDFSKLTSYFLDSMKGPPNPRKLQEILLFNIIYYCGRRGRENLRQMTKETFAVETDHDGREYIIQVVKECDKNHREDDLKESNEARIYANPG